MRVIIQHHSRECSIEYDLELDAVMVSLRGESHSESTVTTEVSLPGIVSARRDNETYLSVAEERPPATSHLSPARIDQTREQSTRPPLRKPERRHLPAAVVGSCIVLVAILVLGRGFRSTQQETHHVVSFSLPEMDRSSASLMRTQPSLRTPDNVRPTPTPYQRLSDPRNGEIVPSPAPGFGMP